MKRIGGLVLVAVCIGVLSNCASPLGLGARDHGDNPGDFHNFPGDSTGGGSGDSGVADATATRSREAQASRDEPRAGGGVLPPFGEFDRNAEGFQLFNPCREIPDEDLQRVGLSRIAGEEFHEKDTIFCSFSHQMGAAKGVVNLASSDTATSEVEEAQDRRVIYEGRRIPAVAFEDQFSGESMCSLNLSTERGLITVSYSLLSDFSNQIEQCEQAEEILVNLT